MTSSSMGEFDAQICQLSLYLRRPASVGRWAGGAWMQDVAGPRHAAQDRPGAFFSVPSDAQDKVWFQEARDVCKALVAGLV